MSAIREVAYESGETNDAEPYVGIFNFEAKNGSVPKKGSDFGTFSSVDSLNRQYNSHILPLKDSRCRKPRCLAAQLRRDGMPKRAGDKLNSRKTSE